MTGKRTMFSWLALVGLLLLQSCSIAATAKEAAKQFWEEEGHRVMTDAGNAAKDYWNANKDNIIKGAKDEATKIGLETLAKANTYTDSKLADQRAKAVQNLLAHGVTMAELDTNSDGNVSDEELAAYVQKNPAKALQYGGVALGIWWALWQLLQRTKKSSAPSGGTTPTTA